MATTSVKGPIPTSTSTTILKAQIILLLTTYAPTTTVTPKAITTTKVVSRTTTTTTTDSTVTGTFSTTETSTSVVTSLTTTTVVSTTTFSSTTSSTSTVIIPTTAGFVNIEQSTGQKTLQQKRDLGQIEAANPMPDVKRSFNRLYSGLIKRTSKPSNPKTYPSSVKCVKSVQVYITVLIIFTKPVTTKTAPAPTSTSTSYTTVTSTSTVVPPSATSTKTFTTTVFSTTVSTSTTTSVTTTTELTTAVSTTSSYAACATNNILGPQLQDGTYIYAVGSNDPDVQLEEYDPTTAYDCCVTCLLSNSCLFSQFVPGSYCATYEDGQKCDNANFVAGSVYRTSTNFQSETISNGPCGQVNDGGSF